MEREIDLEGLLVALTLAPTTFSRNRFFDLYTHPGARHVHRRAKLLRSVLKQLGAAECIENVAVRMLEEGGKALEYSIPSLGLRRMVSLDPLELVVLRYALARVRRPGVCPEDLADSGLRESDDAGAMGGIPRDILAALGAEASDGPRLEAALSRLLPGAWYDEVAQPQPQEGSHVHLLQDREQGDPNEGGAGGRGLAGLP
ncbi:hypothetical protein [Chondromyces crocatus]|uniref:Uncharacterized protein n=1 Tax=Chondromyces crocatus TaxID=52 RepID=A0A0K1ET99_CHOCO|nr:hypothetical protein [Chondromyces crocatus]AKT44029.1 uncharacterized protein CMC5_082670 [Chondromyces crocatus]